MLRWGDRWLGNGKPPLILTHKPCGNDMLPRIVCDHCRRPLDPHQLRCQFGYQPPAGGEPQITPVNARGS